ncbi:Uu.00g106000.m01.CDS01 [Anthostomella pinea]|uniref:Uu.00g106000.m01.CDS01 n=1 Tax=Anthostomella pinea TaxID=933095 RepID=A0AAI8YDF5_9PEZI|nr:Uu.00g106000.m01.CDS01 [Anthostomella pinea]
MGGGADVYSQDYPATPLACSKKHQICISTTSGEPRCTQLATPYEVFDEALQSVAVENQDRLLWTMSSQTSVSGGIDSAVEVLGAQALLSRRGLFYGRQEPLPDSQWQTDVEHWFNVESTIYQKSLGEVAAGPPSSYPEEWVARPTTPEQTKLCNNQVHAPSLSILPKPSPDSLSPLQRLAHEELGIGRWTRGDEAVPVTKVVTNLALLDVSDVSDVKHPRLLLEV